MNREEVREHAVKAMQRLIEDESHLTVDENPTTLDFVSDAVSLLQRVQEGDRALPFVGRMDASADVDVAMLRSQRDSLLGVLNMLDHMLDQARA